MQIPIHSHLNFAAFEILFQDYADYWVLKGAKFGLPLSRDQALPLSGVTWPNHSSCNKHLSQVDTFFAEEVSHGTVFPLGLAPAAILPPISTIPLLCVPKAPSVTKIQVCGDNFSSVNNLIQIDNTLNEHFLVSDHVLEFDMPFVTKR